MSSLTNEEKETVINFNEADKMADVYTINSRLKRRLREISETDPQSCVFLSTDSWGFERWNISKELISLRKPVTAEQRRLRSERAKKLNLGGYLARSTDREGVLD